VAWTTLCLRERLAALDPNPTAGLGGAALTPLERLVVECDPEYIPSTPIDVFVSYAERVNVDHPLHLAARKGLALGRQGFEDAYRRMAIIFGNEMPKVEARAAKEMAKAEGGGASDGASPPPLTGKCLVPQRRAPRLQISDRVKRTKNPFVAEFQERRGGAALKGVRAGADAGKALNAGEQGVSHCPSQIVASLLRSRVVMLLLGPEYFESECVPFSLRSLSTPFS
jgi:hypothetical protein